MNRFRITFQIIIALILLSQTFADSLKISGSNDDVDITVEISSDVVALAEKIDLNAHINAKNKIINPNLTTQSQAAALTSKRTDENTITGSIEPLINGEHKLPLTLKYQHPLGEDKELYIGEFPLKVSLTLTQQQQEALEKGDISPIISVVAQADEPEEAPYDFKIMIITAVILLLAIVAAILILRKKRKTVPEKKYVVLHTLAYNLLDNLKFMNLPQKGNIELYYRNLSNILRRYIELRFDLAAPDMTTEEFLEKTASFEPLDKVDKQQIEKFMRICDMVKFARYQPNSDFHADALNAVNDFVSSTEDYLCTVEQSVGDKFLTVLEEAE